MQRVWWRKQEQWKENHWDFHTLVINTFYFVHDHLCSLCLKFISLAQITISLPQCQSVSYFSIGIFQRQFTNKMIKVNIMKYSFNTNLIFPSLSIFHGNHQWHLLVQCRTQYLFLIPHPSLSPIMPCQFNDHISSGHFSQYLALPP